MLKIFALLICSYCLSYSLMAQQEESSFRRFGFRAGATSSKMDFSKGVPPPTTPIETSSRTGISVGFSLSIPLTDNLELQPEYGYAAMGSTIKADNTIYQLDYLSLPLLVRYKFHEKFSAMAGPQFDLLISAKKESNGTNTTITHDTEERSIAAIAGLEYQVFDPVFISVRYLYGFNHIGIGQRTAVQEFKFTGFQLFAGIRF